MVAGVKIEKNKLIASRDASALSGYTSDYIGQLCRGGKIECKRVGRVWFVDESSLLNHCHKYGNEKPLKIVKENPIEFSQVATGDKIVPTIVSLPVKSAEVSFGQVAPQKGKIAKNFKFDFGRKNLATFQNLQNAIYKASIKAGNSVASGMFVAPSQDFLKKAITIISAFVIVFGSYYLKDSVYVDNAVQAFSNSVRLTKNFVDEIAELSLVDIGEGFIDFGNSTLKFASGKISRSVAGVKENLKFSALTISFAKQELVSNPKDFIFNTGRNLGQTASGYYLAVRDVEKTISSTFVSALQKTTNSIRVAAVAVVDDPLLSVKAVASEFNKSAKNIFNKGWRFATSFFFVPADSEIVLKVPPKGKSASPNKLANYVTIEGPRTIVNQVTERVSYSGVSREEVEAMLSALNGTLRQEIYKLAGGTNGNTVYINNVYNAVSQMNRIDQLRGVTINASSLNDSTIDGATISNSSFSGTTGDFSGNVTIGGTLIVNATVGTSTFSGNVAFDTDTLFVDSINHRIGIATSSPSDTFSLNGIFYLAEAGVPATTDNRLYNSGGDLYWDGMLIGSASVGNWTASGGNVYRLTGNVGVGTSSPFANISIAGIAGQTSPIFAISTSTAGYATSTAFLIDSNGKVGIGTSSPAYELDVAGNLNITGALYQNGTPAVFSNWTNSGSNIYRLSNVGIGTTSPYAKLSVAGGTSGTGIAVDMASGYSGNLLDLKVASSTVFAVDQSGIITSSGLSLGSVFANMLASFDASGNLTSTSTPQVASITATSTATSTFAGGIRVARINTTSTSTMAGVEITSGGLTLGSLAGFLKATAGAVGTAFVDLANDITGILGVNHGGTGWENIQANAILLGNGAGNLATTTAGTNGQVLALLGGIPSWVATTTFSSGLSYSGGNVTNTGLLSLAQTYGTAQTGIITFATSSQTTNGQTIGLNITNSSGDFTFAPTISGTLSVAGGGTGISTIGASSTLAFSNGSTLNYMATSSLGINFTDVVGTLGVSQGGTGQTSFEQGWLGIDDSGAFISSTSPTVAYITATSTTATSTFTGGLQIGGGLTLTGSASNIRLNTNWLSYDGADKGLSIDSSNNVLLSNDDDKTIKVNGVSTGAVGKNLTISSGVGRTIKSGDLYLLGADGSDFYYDNVRGGSVYMFAGNPSGIVGSTGSVLIGGDFDTTHIGQIFIEGKTNAIVNDAGNVYIYGGIPGTIVPGFPMTGGNVILAHSTSTPIGNVGIGTTSPYAKLSVVGETVSAYFTATTSTASSFPYASSTALTVSGALYNTSLSTGGVAVNSSGLLYSYATSTWTFASSTILADSNTFSGNNTFSNLITGSISGNAGTVTNGVYTTDTGTVTNTMLAGAIANDKLANSSLTVNGTAISLGGSGTITAASSTLLANDNTWSGTNAFGTLTASSFNLGVGLAHMLAGFDASGNLTSTSSPQVAYINATSTTATSTFAGGLQAGGSSGLYVLQNGNVGIGTAAPTKKLAVNGNINLLKVTPATAPTAAINATAGNLNGAYTYSITFVTADGETEVSSHSNFVSPVNQQVNLTSIPVSSDSRVTSRNIYRTAAGIGFEYVQLVTTINDNTTTTYTDNLADGSLGVYSPSLNSTGGNIYNNTDNILSATNKTTRFGINAGISSTGFYETFIGQSAGYSNTNGYGNVAVGYQALYANTTGRQNVALGTAALQNNTTANQNIAVGYHALFSNITGENNTAFGNQAAQNINATGNTAVGNYALSTNTTGTSNVSIGSEAAQYDASGIGNVAIGATAFKLPSGGNYNTVIGHSAGQGTLSNAYSNNTILGGLAGRVLTTGSNNVLIGFQTGNALTTGANNIAIGYDIDLPSNTGSNQLSIGNLIFGTGLDGTGTTVSTGNIGIGTTSPWGKLHISTGTGGKVPLATADDLIVQGGASAGMTIMGTANAENNIFFSDPDSNYAGYIQYAHNGDSMRFATAQTERMRITSTGNVGIGTTSPWGKLSVTNTGTTPSFIVEDSTSPDTTPFIIDASGNVGIGTVSPGVELNVSSGNSDASVISLTNPNVVIPFTDIVPEYTVLTIGQEYSTVGGAIITGTNENGNYTPLVLRGLSASTNPNNTVPLIKLVAGMSDGATGITNTSTSEMILQVLNNTNPLLTLLGSGYMSLGTSTVDEGLTVPDGIKIFDRTSPYDTLVQLYDSSDDGVIDVLADTVVTARIHGNGSSYFNGGNLGIGTTTPVSLLQVAGATAPKITLSDTDATTQKHWFLESNSNNFNIGTTSDALVTNSSYRALTILNTGNIGMGIAVPTELLHVYSAVNNADLMLETSATGGAARIFLKQNGPRSNGLEFSKISFSGFDTLGNQEYANIGVFEDATTDGAEQGRIVFRTMASGVLTDLLTLKSDKVGIGTTSPYAKLSVEHLATTGTIIGTDALTGFTGNLLDMKVASTSKFSVDGTGAVTFADDLIFTNSATSTVTMTNGLNFDSNTLVIDPNSNRVGIGTAAPSTFLNVVGSSVNQIATFEGTGSTATLSIGNTYATDRSAAIVIAGSTSGKSHFQFVEGGLNGSARWQITADYADSDKLIFGAPTYTSPKMVLTQTGNLGIGTTSPWGLLSVAALSSNTSPLFTISTSTASATSTAFIIDSNGKVGIGTTTPSQELSVSGNGYFSGTLAASSLAGATSCLQAGEDGIITRTGSACGAGGSSFGQGWELSTNIFSVLALSPTTTVPISIASVATSTFAGGIESWAKIGAPYFVATSSTATSTFAGGLNVGSGGLVYDFSSAVTSISVLETGNLNFETDAGAVSWVDLPLSAAPAGTVESYTAQIAGTSVLTVYGQSAGSGAVKNLRVGIGTTTPFATLSVSGTTTSSTSNAFIVADVASTTRFVVQDAGNVGVGTTTPGTIFSIQSGATGVASFTTATSTIYNNLYVVGTLRSTTSYNGDLFFANDFSFTELLPLGASTTQALLLKNQFGTTTLAIDENGNLGLGTTSPLYKLHVLGDVGAEAFINISTRDAKKDITYIGDEDALGLLEKIKGAKVANYRYLDEDVNSPLRFGLIAEEAPVEILSPNGKGVDIYKLSSVLLAGLQAEEKKIANLEARVATLEGALANGGFLISSTTISTLATGGVSVQSVVDYFISLGAKIGAGVAEFKKVVAEAFTVGSATAPAGITLYDEITKAPYCFKMSGGMATTTAGECQLTNNNSQPRTGENTGTTTPDGTGDGTATTTPDGTGDQQDDVTPPVITLLGNNPAEINKGSSYVDVGATAVDSQGNSLMPDITENTVDTSKTGEYIVVWTVHDSNLNYASTTRKVIVVDPHAGVTPPISTTTPPIIPPNDDGAGEETGTTTPLIILPVATSTSDAVITIIDYSATTTDFATTTEPII